MFKPTVSHKLPHLIFAIFLFRCFETVCNTNQASQEFYSENIRFPTYTRICWEFFIKELYALWAVSFANKSSHWMLFFTPILVFQICDGVTNMYVLITLYVFKSQVWCQWWLLLLTLWIIKQKLYMEFQVYFLVIEPLNIREEKKNCLGNSQVGCCYGSNLYSHWLWMNCKINYGCA